MQNLVSIMWTTLWWSLSLVQKGSKMLYSPTWVEVSNTQTEMGAWAGGLSMEGELLGCWCFISRLGLVVRGFHSVITQ